MIATTKRKIVHIDEDKCDGCGECVPSCAEGAIRIVDGKAKLVSDVYCDGLGACLGNCPRGAITIVEREAAPFDDQAVAKHLTAAAAGLAPAVPSDCPSRAVSGLQLQVLSDTPAGACSGASRPFQHEAAGALANWPIQLHLVPPNAPFLQQADLLLVADCVPVACVDFHQRFVAGNPILIGCPKLDDGMQYVQKLIQIIRTSSLNSLAVLMMEVPCCTGLLRIAESAIAASGIDLPLRTLVVSTRGELVSKNC